MIDEARFAPRPDRTAIAARWQALEAAAEAAVPAARRTVLRAAPVPLPDGDDDFSRLLAGRLALSVPGHDPSLQLLDAEDLAAAVERAAAGPPGTYNVVPAASVPLGRALRLAGVRRLPVPLWAQRLARRAAAAAGSPRGAERPESLRYSWTASGDLAERELGFTARHGSAATVARFAAARAGRAVPEEPAVPAYDDFGVDPDYIAAYGRTLFRFLHDAYWRIEWRGLEHLPRQGPVVLTGVHRGFMPFDGVMALHLLARETGRIPRFLLHPTLLKFPFLHDFMTRLGGIPACRENAARVLGSGEIVGIFPEGIRGAFTPYRRAYRLGKFGRDDYVRMALESRAPILPFVTVGSAEIFPILARLRWGWWKRYSLWPAFPITPTFPWLPVPLPSKWHTVFLPPIHVERTWGPEAADDPAVVARISAEVRRQMALALGEMLTRRRSIFFGSVFEDAPGRTVPGEAR
jgi:1-acyl-sn-glycerol-3-phosphate acyltransferase